MKKAALLTSAQLTKWADKTRKSIDAYCSKNTGINRMQSNRAYDLIDRYTELLEEMQNRGTWSHYCDSRFLNTEHNAYDLFA